MAFGSRYGRDVTRKPEYAVRALPLALAFACETVWLNMTIPRPRTADLAGVAAQVMAMHAHAIINCSMWLLFSVWLEWKVEGSSDIGVKMLFTPFYIQWGLTFAVRFGLSWYCADRPAGGHERDRENMPLTKALNFSVFANLTQRRAFSVVSDAYEALSSPPRHFWKARPSCGVRNTTRCV